MLCTCLLVITAVELIPNDGLVVSTGEVEHVARLGIDEFVYAA